MKPGNPLRSIPAKRKHWFLPWSGRLLSVAGVLLLSYCAYVFFEANAFQAEQSRRFDAARAVAKAGAASDERTALPTSLPDTEAALTSDEAGAAAEPGSTPLGRIEIERVGMAAMVMEGIDRRTLRHAVGHIPGTALPSAGGNVGIAGHRDTFFRELRLVRNDDAITLTTLTGSYRYRVDSILVLEPNETWVLQDTGDDRLTLVTCYPFSFVGPAPQRFVVRASRIMDQASQAAPAR